MTRRICISFLEDAEVGRMLRLRNEQAHYIKNVLRLKKGSRITVFDGKGRQYDCSITDIKPKDALLRVLAAGFCLSKETAYKATLAQAIPNRPGKMDFIIEKATELGVDAIIPIAAVRSVVKLNQGPAEAKQRRWQKIASEAARQSGRSTVPKIEGVVSVEKAAVMLNSAEIKLFPCINKETAALRDALGKVCAPKTIAVFIGPEGDFSQPEIEAAKNLGFKPVSLGERVLRTETAGLYVLSVLDYVFGRESPR